MGPHVGEKKRGSHSVTIVGYGVENDVKYYLIKNSWGSHWGTDGYAKVKRELLSRMTIAIGAYVVENN